MADAPPLIVPPVIYLPVRDDASLEKIAAMRKLNDGRMALLAFSALDRLVDACGPNQEWVVVNLGEVDEIKKQTPFDVMVLDPEVPASARQFGRLA